MLSSYDYFFDKVNAFKSYVDSLDFYHTGLTRTVTRLLELRGKLSFALSAGLLTVDEYKDFIESLDPSTKKLQKFLNRRAKWTAERLEDYLGENPSVHRVTVNVYNDLLDNVFEGGFTFEENDD